MLLKVTDTSHIVIFCCIIVFFKIKQEKKKKTPVRIETVIKWFVLTKIIFFLKAYIEKVADLFYGTLSIKIALILSTYLRFKNFIDFISLHIFLKKK